MATNEIKLAFEFLQQNETSMSLNQISFIKSLKKDFVKSKQLSDKQQSILFEIKNYCSAVVETDEKKSIKEQISS